VGELMKAMAANGFRDANGASELNGNQSRDCKWLNLFVV